MPTLRAEMSWGWFLVLCLTGVGGLVQAAQAQVIKSTVEFETCVGASTILSDKNVCYVRNLETRDQKVVVKLCTGININEGTIVLGGKWSSMLCSTVEFPIGTDRKTAETLVQERLREALIRNSEVQSALKRELNYSGPIRDVAPFTIKEDPAYEGRLRRLLEDIEKAKRAQRDRKTDQGDRHHPSPDISGSTPPADGPVTKQPRGEAVRRLEQELAKLREEYGREQDRLAKVWRDLEDQDRRLNDLQNELRREAPEGPPDPQEDPDAVARDIERREDDRIQTGLSELRRQSDMERNAIDAERL
jgi:hypothetical protein